MGISSSLSFGFGMLGQETEREKNPRIAVSDQKNEQKNIPCLLRNDRKMHKGKKRRGKHEFDEIYFAVAWMDPRSDYMPTHMCNLRVHMGIRLSGHRLSPPSPMNGR